MLNKVSLALGLFVSVASVSSAVQAHGWAEFPSARQNICYNDGGFWSNAIPNAACKAAFEKSGVEPFMQRNEVAALTPDFNNINAVKANIKDGQLCSAGMAGKAGLDLPNAEWQKTEIQLDANGEFDFVWTATAPHNPSFWEFYLTKPGHDFSQPLEWDDLDLVYKVGDITPTDVSPYKTYNFKVKLPKDRAGDAVLYSRWQRDDPAGEGFYNCSDITIKQSEDGGVTPPVVENGHLHAIPGYFTGSVAKAPSSGDTLRFRLMAPVTGSEVYDLRFNVTAANQATWAESFASVINSKDDKKLFVGVWDKTSGQYKFDTKNINANQVWVAEKDYAFALSHFTQLDPSIPPVVEPEPPVVGDVAPYEAGKKYVEGDKVLAKDGNVYQCKPWPNSAWCAQASYEPSVSTFWADAWNKL